MVTKQADIPNLSILKKDEKSFHYIDSFQSQCVTKQTDCDISSIGKLFLSSSPKWADYLMSIRDKLVGVFGLKTAGKLTTEQKNPDNFKFEPGEQFDIFKLLDRSENEIILGENDKHLNFRVSLLLEEDTNEVDKKKLTITTAVKFNNLSGKLYFIPVKPFHKLIVRSTLKKIVQQLEQRTAK